MVKKQEGSLVVIDIVGKNLDFEKIETFLGLEPWTKERKVGDSGLDRWSHKVPLDGSRPIVEHLYYAKGVVAQIMECAPVSPLWQSVSIWYTEQGQLRRQVLETGATRPAMPALAVN